MGKPLKVLIAENNENDAMLMVDCLCQAGYDLQWQRVDTLPGFAAALTAPGGWDVIFSDYSLPGFGGPAALEIYKKSGLDVPFLIVSGSIGEERAVEALRSGAHDYIMKDRMQRLAPAVDRQIREVANNRRLTSELVELNEALTNQIALLSRSHADLEQVTWAVSHDLKEPLRTIAMYSQLLLRRRPPANQDENDFVQYIDDGIERARALLDGLLTYSRNLRAPTDTKARTDADEVAREAVRNLGAALEESSGEITVSPLPFVTIEHNALLDVFERLLLNALEFRREGVPPRVRITSSRLNGEICFAIADNGIGIKPEHHARVFELFRPLDGAEHPGIGVGLPLCKRLIENYGGRLWLESEPGVGSTFYFSLAAADRAANANA